MCKVIRVEHKSQVRFGLRRLDRSTIGIGNKYFKSIGEARKYAETIGLIVLN